LNYEKLKKISLEVLKKKFKIKKAEEAVLQSEKKDTLFLYVGIFRMDVETLPLMLIPAGHIWTVISRSFRNGWA
jgi:hypothetical protein